MQSIFDSFKKFFGVGFQLQTYLNLIYLVLAFPLGVVYFVFLVVGFSVGLSTSMLLVGLVILAFTLAAAWVLAAFERQQAIWLLRVSIGPMARPPAGPGAWNSLKAYVGNPVTWSGLFFLALKFPLGVMVFCVTVTLLALSAGLLLAPFTFWWAPVVIFFWRITTLPEALVLFVAGLVIAPLALHILNFLAYGLGQLARLMLGAPAAPSQPAPVPASGWTCLLPFAALALFACVGLLVCSAVAWPLIFERHDRGRRVVSTEGYPTVTVRPATATVHPATAPLPTPTATSTAVPSATATVLVLPSPTSTLAPSATPAASATPTPSETASPSATPTETPLPTATATPAGPDPLANAGPVLFEETFGPPAYYWGGGEGAFSRIQVQAGALTLTVKTPKRTAWTFSGAPTRADFYVTATVTPTTCTGDDQFGLVFRAKDDGNLFLFGIACDGRYQLTQNVSGAARVLLPLTPSAALQPQAANQLGVRAVGKQVSLYANGQFLTTVDVDTAAKGLFGVYAASANTAGLSVAFDDFKAWGIKP